jgi:hypothetical protein
MLQPLRTLCSIGFGVVSVAYNNPEPQPCFSYHTADPWKRRSYKRSLDGGRDGVAAKVSRLRASYCIGAQLSAVRESKRTGGEMRLCPRQVPSSKTRTENRHSALVIVRQSEHSPWKTKPSLPAPGRRCQHIAMHLEASPQFRGFRFLPFSYCSTHP